jgi:hypothetical protein
VPCAWCLINDRDGRYTHARDGHATVMVPFKNVTVAVAAVSQAVLADRTVGNPSAGASWSCSGYLEHLTPGEAYLDYGVLLKSPAVFQVDVSDFVAAATAAGVTPSAFADALANAQITVTAHIVGIGAFVGNVYGAQGRPTSYDEGLPADHVLFVLEQKMYALGNAGGAGGGAVDPIGIGP